MTTYQVNANAIEMNIEAGDAKEARDIFCRMAGYASEAEMEERLGADSEIKAVALS